MSLLGSREDANTAPVTNMDPETMDPCRRGPRTVIMVMVRMQVDIPLQVLWLGLHLGINRHLHRRLLVDQVMDMKRTRHTLPLPLEVWEALARLRAWVFLRLQAWAQHFMERAVRLLPRLLPMDLRLRYVFEIN